MKLIIVSQPARTLGFGRIAARVSLLTLGTQVFSFVSAILIAHLLGASRATDAYFLGLSVPTFVYGVFLSAIRAGAIPALTDEARSRTGFAQASSELVSVTFALTLILSFVAAGVVAALLPVTGTAPALVGPTRMKILELAPLGLFGAMIAALAAILAVRGRFAAAALVLAFDPILRIVLLLLFSATLGTTALVAANLGGNALAVAVLWTLVRRQGVPLRMRPTLRSPFIRRTLRVTWPLLLCQIAVGTNPVIDRAMTGHLSSGSITTLELGFRLFSVPITLVGATLIGPLTATWAARRSQGGFSALQGSVNRGIETFTTVVPPVLVLGIVLRHQMVGLIYHGGAYSGHATNKTATVLAMFELGAPASLVTIAFATLFVIEQRTKFVLMTGLVNFGLNAGLDWLLRGPLGVGGIALSTSVTYTLVLSIYIIAARTHWTGLMIPFAGRRGFVVGVSSAVMTLAALGVDHLLRGPTGRVALAGQILAVGVIGIAAYSTVLLLDDDWRQQLSSVARRFSDQRLPLRASHVKSK